MRIRPVLTLVSIFILLFLNTTLLASEKGKISGTIVAGETGEAMIGANVYLEGTSLGAATDIDGRYVVQNVPIGKYELVVMMIGYAEFRVKNLIVKTDNITRLDVTLKSELMQTEVVTVEARSYRNTEAALLSQRQNALAISDAISTEAISRSGSGNAAEAMKQVTGASVVDGKYVYIRGLGDRYTSTQLDGAQMPSSDPYKRSGSINLIPTSLIDNIVTLKSFTPDKQGNFSGGRVDINTRDFPEMFQYTFSTSSSYNSQTSTKTGLGYSGSSTDWLGYDNGTRALPAIMKGQNVYIPDVGQAGSNPNDAALLTRMTRSFSIQMAPVTKTVPVNQSFGVSLGNQYAFFGHPFGLLASFSYKNSHASYKNGIYRRWSQGTQDVISNVYDFNDQKSTDEILWGGLAKMSYKISPLNQLGLSVIYNRNAVSEARLLEGQYNYDSDANRIHRTSVLSYKERSLASYQFKGKHVFSFLGDLKFNWRVSSGNTNEQQPDRRVLSDYYFDKNGVRNYGIKDNLPPKRYFRGLDENRDAVKADFEFPFKQWAGRSAKIKAGSFFSTKKRGYTERLFTFSDQQGFNYDGNPNNLLSNSTTGVIDTNVVVIRGKEYRTLDWGVVVVENVLPANNYRARQDVAAHYAMMELPVTDQLRFVGGARFEHTNMWLQTQDSSLNRGNINVSAVLPSVNFIYALADGMNLRAAFAKTLARPAFREIGPFATYEFDDGGDAFIGNPNLKQTFIQNADLRWEWFTRPGEIYAISAFYKKFDNPIERVFNAFGENTWKNIDKAQAFGLELEARRRLDVIHSSLANFLLSTNISFIRSRVAINKDELMLIRNLRPDASANRPFQGQSPFLVNMNLAYENSVSGISASLYYNVFGKRLDRVSFGGTPDVYEKPVGLLNFNFGLAINPHMSFKIAGQNLLNPDYVKYQSFKGHEYIYSSYQRGRTFSIGISLKN